MTLTTTPSPPLAGSYTLPGDKSLAHRAALFAALAEGESVIGAYPLSGVTRAMLDALSAFGVPWSVNNGTLTVRGAGLRGLRPPAAAVDCRNSATTIRLFAGAAAAAGVPCILDGSVVTAGALVAEALAPGARQWWIAGHRSAEPAHSAALSYLSMTPVLEHSMRLGEGSGAVAALPTVKAAIAVLAEMATFADAGVSGKGD